MQEHDTILTEILERLEILNQNLQEALRPRYEGVGHPSDSAQGSQSTELSAILKKLVDKETDLFRHPRLDPPVYKGESNRKTNLNFLVEAEQYFITRSRDKSRRSQEQWLLEVPALLKGVARFWFDDNNITSWPQFKEELVLHSTGHSTVDALHDELNDLRQGNRRVNQYALEFDQMIKLMGSANITLDARTKEEKFIQGLNDTYRVKANEFLLNLPSWRGSDVPPEERLKALRDYLDKWGAKNNPNENGLLPPVQVNKVNVAKQNTARVAWNKSNQSKGPLKKCYICGGPWDPKHWCPRFCQACGRKQVKQGRCPCSQPTQVNMVDAVCPEIQEKPGPDRGSCDLGNEKEESAQKGWTDNKESPDNLQVYSSYERSEFTFRFEGKLENKTVRILIDSGARRNVISETFVHDNHIQTAAGSPLRMKMADGSMISLSGSVVSTHKLCFYQTNQGMVKTAADMIVAPLTDDFDILLGDTWAKEHRVELSYDKGALFLPKQNKTLHPLDHPTSILVPAYKMVTVLQDFNENDIVGVAYVTTKSLPRHQGTLTSDETKSKQNILNEFADMMVDGLPPYPGIDKYKCGVEHKIQEYPGSAPPCEPYRRMSTTLLEELKSQLDALLEKGFIKPSESPYGSPVLFNRKNMGNYDSALTTEL